MKILFKSHQRLYHKNQRRTAMRTIIQLLKDVAESHGEHTYLTGKTDNGRQDVSFAQADKLTGEAAAWWLSTKRERTGRFVGT